MPLSIVSSFYSIDMDSLKAGTWNLELNVQHRMQNTEHWRRIEHTSHHIDIEHEDEYEDEHEHERWTYRYKIGMKRIEMTRRDNKRQAKMADDSINKDKMNEWESEHVDNEKIGMKKWPLSSGLSIKFLYSRF